MGTAMSRKNNIEPVYGTPKCFHNHQQFVIWMAAARNTGGCFEASYCTDCTPEYKARMLAEKRCDHPDIVFGPDEHGFIQGMVQLPEQQQQLI
jgi:hypothetical protein